MFSLAYITQRKVRHVTRDEVNVVTLRVVVYLIASRSNYLFMQWQCIALVVGVLVCIVVALIAAFIVGNVRLVSYA